MRWMLLALLGAAGCSLYEPCEPSIEYDAEPGIEGFGCKSLMFVDEPMPMEWYAIGTNAFVRECHDDSRSIRSFSCQNDGTWQMHDLP